MRLESLPTQCTFRRVSSDEAATAFAAKGGCVVAQTCPTREAYVPHDGRRHPAMLTLQALPPPEPPTDAIVVTGTALADPAGERAYDVQVIGGQQLADAPTHQLEQVLKQVPGLQLFRRSDSTSGHPTSQGVTLRALGGNASSRALLVLDGVPQADPFGSWVTWPAYDPAGLDEVRVVRGGGSVTHGPGALAGVIEMRSLALEGANGSLEAGSRQSVHGRIYVGTGLGPGLVTLNVQGSRSNGFVPLTAQTRGLVDRPAPYRQGSVRARWIAPIATGAELQASALAFADQRERGVPFTANRTRGADVSLRLVGAARWQWSATGYAQWRNFKSSFAGVDDDRTEAQRVALQDSVPSQGFGGSVELRPPVGSGIELRLGADARFTSGESRELYAFAEGEPARRRVAGGNSDTQGLFAETAWTRGALTLSGGVRLDHWRIWDGELVEHLLATGRATRDEHYPSRGGWRPGARAAALVDVGGGLGLRSAAYLGWRAPTLNELFRPFRAGADATAANPRLKPERLAGAEAGIRYSRGAAGLSLTAFVNRLSDSIANVTLGHGPGIFPGVGFVAGTYRQRQNLAYVGVRGLEASGELRREPWRFRLGAAYSDAEIDAEGAASALGALRPAQTPKFTLAGGVAWDSGGRAASLLIRHVGSQFEDDLNKRRLAPATTFDAFLTWPLRDKLHFIARAENLLNETVVAGIGDDLSVERGTPRTLWLGLRIR